MKAKNKLNLLINAYRSSKNVLPVKNDVQKYLPCAQPHQKAMQKNAKVFAGVSKIGHDLKETQKKPKISTGLMNPSFKLSYNENK